MSCQGILIGLILLLTVQAVERLSPFLRMAAFGYGILARESVSTSCQGMTTISGIMRVIVLTAARLSTPLLIIRFGYGSPQ